MRFSHVALNCQDLALSEAFYQRFGFKRSRLVYLGEQQIVYLKLGDVYLELFQAEGEGPATTADGPHQRGSIRHLAFQVDDVDATLKALGELDISLGPMGFDDFIPGWRTVWVKDPDGTIVEISQGFKDDPKA